MKINAITPIYPIYPLQETVMKKKILKGAKDKPRLEYIRSLSELKSILKDNYGSSDINALVLAKLFAEYNMVVVDSLFPMDFDVKELLKYIEFDRRPNKGKASASEEDYEKLKKSIMKKGMHGNGVITISRLHNGDVTVFVSEGNHRIAIAKEIGKKTMIMNVYYMK